MEFRAILAFLMLFSVSFAACWVGIPQFANASQMINATPTPVGTYTFIFKDGNGATLQALSSNSSYAIASAYNQTRVYVYANSSTDSCSNHSLILTSDQQLVQNNLFSDTVMDWFNSYASLILGIFVGGIAYAVTVKIGHACLAASLMYAALYILLLNPIFILGAVSLLAIGLFLTYAQV